MAQNGVLYVPFLSADAYTVSFISPRMTYYRVRCITVSYCGLVHPPVQFQYFILEIFSLLSTAKLLILVYTPRMPFAIQPKSGGIGSFKCRSRHWDSNGGSLSQTPRRPNKTMLPPAEPDRNSGLEIVPCLTSPRPDQLPWYALRIQSRLGSLASTTLRGKGYQEFFPLYRSLRRWSDRTKELELPLFPGYLFCQFDVSDRLPVLTTPGVIGIVGAGKIPVPVDLEEIEAIRAILRSGLAAQPWPSLRVGSKVYIERGPLTGLEGIITNTDKIYRLIVSVSLLQRAVAVEIDRDWARPIAPAMGPRAVTLAERTRPLARLG